MREVDLKRNVTVFGKKMRKQKVFNFLVFPSLDNLVSLYIVNDGVEIAYGSAFISFNI